MSNGTVLLKFIQAHPSHSSFKITESLRCMFSYDGYDLCLLFFSDQVVI